MRYARKDALDTSRAERVEKFQRAETRINSGKDDSDDGCGNARYTESGGNK
jgi:hypothetical protein